MTTGDSISGTKTKIYLEDANTAGTALSSGISAIVTKFEPSGGKKPLETEAVFNNGKVPLSKPQEDFELKVESIMRFGTDTLIWDTAFNSGDKKMVAYHGTDDTNHYWEAFNNAVLTDLQKTTEASGELKISATFTVPSTTAEGVANKTEGEDDIATELVWA